MANQQTDVLVAGAGLARLAAAADVADHGLSVIVIDQEGESSFAGQAFWSLGGGGYHGYNVLAGTFPGGCIFSGRNAGRAV